MSVWITKLGKTISKDMQAKSQCKTLNGCGIFGVVFMTFDREKKYIKKYYLKNIYTVYIKRTVNANILNLQLFN